MGGAVDDGGHPIKKLARDISNTPLSEGEGTSHCADAAPRICSHKKAQARFHFTPIGVFAIFGHILLPHLSLFLLFFQFDHAMSFM